jgi:hypothetical protein
MRSTTIASLVFTIGLAAPAFAQAPDSAPPTRIRGTVEKFADHTLTVKARGGDLMTVILAPEFTVRAVVSKRLDDIKPGDKVGITSIKAADGTRKAIEIHIFPASMTTVRLAESPWDRGPDSLMTNAQVAEASSAPGAGKLKVTLNGKESEIAVPPETPIVTYAPGEAALLQPGAAVFVIARKQPDGKLTATGVTAEKEGVKPPM